MKRPRICPVCGKEAGAAAVSCDDCGAPYELETRRAASLERLRSYRFVVTATLALALAWWVAQQRGGLQRTGGEILETIRRDGLAAYWSDSEPYEQWYLSHVVAVRLKRRYEDELRSALKRLGSKVAGPAADEAPPAEQDEGEPSQ